MHATLEKPQVSLCNIRLTTATDPVHHQVPIVTTYLKSPEELTEPSERNLNRPIRITLHPPHKRRHSYTHNQLVFAVQLGNAPDSSRLHGADVFGVVRSLLRWNSLSETQKVKENPSQKVVFA